MKISVLPALLFCAIATLPALHAGRAQAPDESTSTAIGTRTIEGLVRDIACPLQNTRSTSKNYSKDCIMTCFKAGSPLGILTDDGTVYLPVTETMPDSGQEKLKQFVGEHVQATGKVFERNSARAIEITEIRALPASGPAK